MKAKIEKSSFKISKKCCHCTLFFFNTTSYLYISLSLLVFKYFMTERHRTTVEENLSSQPNSKILGLSFSELSDTVIAC